MTLIDVIIIVAALVGSVRGFMTGLVRQVIGLAGFIVALVLALELMPFFARRVSEPLGFDGLAGRVLAFLIVFVAIEAIVLIVSILVHRGVGALKLSFLNRLGGAAAGVAKTLLLASVVFVLLARLDVPSESARRESLLYGPTVLLVPSAWDLIAVAWPRIQTVSEKFGDEVRSYFSEPEDEPPPALEAEPG